MIIPSKNLSVAMHQAFDNADRFGHPYSVFFDTSGNLRIEAGLVGMPAAVVHPLPGRVAKMHLQVLEEQLSEQEVNAQSVWSPEEEEEDCYYKTALFDALKLSREILAEVKEIQKGGGYGDEGGGTDRGSGA